MYDACEALAGVMGNGEFALNTAVDSGTFGWTTVAAQQHVAGHLPISDDWTSADAEDAKYEELINFYKTLQDNAWIPRQPLEKATPPRPSARANRR